MPQAANVAFVAFPPPALATYWAQARSRQLQAAKDAGGGNLTPAEQMAAGVGFFRPTRQYFNNSDEGLQQNFDEASKFVASGWDKAMFDALYGGGSSVSAALEASANGATAIDGVSASARIAQQKSLEYAYKLAITHGQVPELVAAVIASGVAPAVARERVGRIVGLSLEDAHAMGYGAPRTGVLAHAHGAFIGKKSIAAMFGRKPAAGPRRPGGATRESGGSSAELQQAAVVGAAAGGAAGYFLLAKVLGGKVIGGIAGAVGGYVLASQLEK